jgi:membrane-associated phospholipid phosphatase
MNQPRAKAAKNKWMFWAMDSLAAILLTIAAAKFAYFPLDVELTNFVQAITGTRIGWAQIITQTASAPYSLLLFGITAVMAWRMAGWRAAGLALVSFVGLLLAIPLLKALVARPRPPATLVQVFGSPTDYSYPSGFALTYFALFGYLAVLASHRLTGKARGGVLLACTVILLVGGWARVALGAHWPSDIYGAYLIGLVWTKVLVMVGLRNPSFSAQNEN